jgi:hypothetical protein
MSNEKERAKNNRASFWAHVYTHTMVYNNTLSVRDQTAVQWNYKDPTTEADAALGLYDARFNKPSEPVNPVPAGAVPDPKQDKPKEQPVLRCKEPGCKRPLGHDGPHLIK